MYTKASRQLLITGSVFIALTLTSCGEKQSSTARKSEGSKFVVATPPPGYVEQQMAKRAKGPQPGPTPSGKQSP